MNNEITTGDVEGSKIEREKKYIINDYNSTKIIAENIPDEIAISMTESEDIDDTTINLLTEIIPQFKEHAEVIIKRATYLKKHRPNYYFDTKNNDLHKNRISFNLRERDNDWAITIKLRPQYDKSDLIERIEINCQVDNEIIEKARDGKNININKLVNNSQCVKSAYKKHIENITKNEALIVVNSYIIESTSADYVFGTNGKITISVDEIVIAEDKSKNLYEMEIEIKFGLHKTWLDTISMRVFDLFCSAIIKKIKTKLINVLDPELHKELLEKTTTLSKLERVKKLPERIEIKSPTTFNDKILYTSLEGKGHAISFLSNFLSKIFNIQSLKDNMPLIFCSYLISITKTYPDVKPFTDQEMYLDIDTFKNYLKEEMIDKFEKTIDKIKLNPNLVIDSKNDKLKLLILKLTETNYFFGVIFPVSNYLSILNKEKETKYFSLFDISNSILLKMLKNVQEEFKHRKIFEDIQIDCALLYDKADLSLHGSQTKLDSITLIKIDKENIETKQKLKRKILTCEARLNQLISKRYKLRKAGFREPIIIIEDKWKMFINLFSSDKILQGNW
ncbi:MAG: hypothetical protein OEV44_08970 [Spirochaetota bacterium]|nr:hypothetical protein [Spirochaetota bacterium]